MNDTLTVRLSKSLADALKTESEQTGVSRGEIARQAIQARLQGKGKPAVMERYAGIMSGPPDLSTNKEYKKRWGARKD